MIVQPQTMKINHLQSGFSLFEIIVYLAIFSMVIVSILTIAARSLGSKAKALAITEVEYNTRYPLQRISSDVRSAVDINETNFASNRLTLTMANGDEVEYVVTDNILTIERNSAGAVALTSDAVSVDSFTVQDISPISPAGSEITDMSVTISVSVTSLSGRPEYNADAELTSAMSIRKPL